MNEGENRETGTAKTKESLRWYKNTSIAAAIITGTATILAALIIAAVNASINDQGKAATNFPVTPTSTLITSTNVTSATQATERREHYVASFDDSTVEGDVVWPSSGPVRLAGVFKLQGSLARSDCSVKAAFEARASDGRIVTGNERACSSELWPEFGTVYFDTPTKIARVDILIFVNGKLAKRIICPGSGECHLE